ncbi:chemotaxis protein CheW [Methylobacterium sp. J-059]|uniref:chemotaxis protein CheW n=1 Tax=Methylobacterium sp. J-059 TaxID=2836643 RepID=UPI001FBB42E2|nr:chemotaxis protein CheW [Methylobacterium sp. J-059]MCJ2039699.1 chemotaxis protein CheW [Methylobacterium sp. J-059]
MERGDGRHGREAALRADRTAALARRGAMAREAAPVEAHLVCACGPERFGLPLADVARVVPMRSCTPVPGAPPAILGLVALSGRIVSVVGLARALGRPGADRVEGGHLVVLRTAATPTALAVDRVLGLAHLAEAAAAEGGFGGEAVSRYAAADPGPSGLGDFVVIDLPQLLRRTLP